MRSALAFAPALSLALLSLSPAQASQAPPAVRDANGRFTAQERGKLAVNAVRQSLTGWVKPGAKVSVRPAIVPFGGDVSNPITGVGPVEVFVEHERAPVKGFFRRLVARLDPHAKQKYLVHVGEDGETEILQRLSLAPHRRFARFVSEKLPLMSMTIDFIRSRQAKEGAWTLAGASGTAFVNPWLSGALFMRLATVVNDGIKSQHAARKEALASLIVQAKDGYKANGRWMNLRQAYGRYKELVEDNHEGARPLGLGEFAAALSFRQL